MQHQQNVDCQAQKFIEHVTVSEGHKTIIANPAQVLFSHESRVEFYNGNDRKSLKLRDLQRIRELNESNDNLHREVFKNERDIPTSQDPLTLLAEIEQCKILIARNTGEILNIHSLNDRRLSRIAELEAQNLDLQQEISDSQGNFITCQELNQRSHHAAGYFYAKATYEKNMAELRELIRE